MMKCSVAWSCAAVLEFSLNLSADLITVNGSEEGDPGNLSHYRAYMWRINLLGHGLPADDEIIGVALKIEDICSWRAEPNALYISMPDRKTPCTAGDLIVAEASSGFHLIVVKRIGRENSPGLRD